MPKEHKEGFWRSPKTDNKRESGAEKKELS
jgi:hypothetical protein